MSRPPVHLVLGASGQVGFELVQVLQPHGQVVGLSRPDVDLERPDTVRDAIRDHHPAIIWNAAAATAVDALEDDPDLAFRVNATAPGLMAEEARRAGALLVHFSTDYVFDGTKPTPYVEDDRPYPLNVYGRSKLAGELAVREGGGQYLILRTSWIYSSRGRNFLQAILGRATGAVPLSIVSDQRGAPTWSREVARGSVGAAQRILASGGSGLFHLTAEGACSWFEFADAIRDLLGDSVRWVAPLVPVSTIAYGSRAPRPLNSVLSNERLSSQLGIRMGHWRAGLAELCVALRGSPSTRGGRG